MGSPPFLFVKFFISKSLGFFFPFPFFFCFFADPETPALILGTFELTGLLQNFPLFPVSVSTGIPSLPPLPMYSRVSDVFGS